MTSQYVIDIISIYVLMIHWTSLLYSTYQSDYVISIVCRTISTDQTLRIVHSPPHPMYCMSVITTSNIFGVLSVSILYKVLSNEQLLHPLLLPIWRRTVPLVLTCTISLYSLYRPSWLHSLRNRDLVSYSLFLLDKFGRVLYLLPYIGYLKQIISSPTLFVSATCCFQCQIVS